MQALSHLCRRWGQDAPWDQHAKMGSLRYKLAFTPSFTRSFKSWPCLLGHCRNRTFKPIQIYSLFGCQTQHWGSFIGTVSNKSLAIPQTVYSSQMKRKTSRKKTAFLPPWKRQLYKPTVPGAKSLEFRGQPAYRHSKHILLFLVVGL